MDRQYYEMSSLNIFREYYNTARKLKSVFKEGFYEWPTLARVTWRKPYVCLVFLTTLPHKFSYCSGFEGQKERYRLCLGTRQKYFENNTN